MSYHLYPPDHDKPEDHVQWISKTRPLAKKLYKCASCGKPIQIGEKHIKQIYKQDGKFKSHREHINCV